ncbi:MAG: 3-deoxy-7-phosphoheptulonate synthase class II [Bacteroidota bacterium]
MQVRSQSMDWSPSSWQAKEALQQPVYEDEGQLRAICEHLSSVPPLVTSWEAKSLQRQLAEAAHGRRFLLQGGDCAERFDECRVDIIANRLKVLLQMSLALVYGLKLPVVRVGRFAGQYAKPRSSGMETRGDVSLPSYRGDIINGPAFTEADRTPDPQRLIQAHSYSALVLNYVRALSDSGFANLKHPEQWNLEFVHQSPWAQEYRRMVSEIQEAIQFMETVSNVDADSLGRVDFYTSHEALHLHYEEAFTRGVPGAAPHYNLSTHMPWIGMRTAQPGGAHVEYARGIANPLGLKVGPAMSPSMLRTLIQTLNPDNTPGRLTLIHRFGVHQIETLLPPLLEVVRAEGADVLWCCDPMHGNTETTDQGIKTRHFDKILGELEHAFDIHAAEGTILGGVHLELTGEDVTECIGGARGLEEADLQRAYTSHVDPRLNYEQALEMTFCIVRKRRRSLREGQ